MTNKKSPQTIIDYWDAVERFTIHKLDTKRKSTSVHLISKKDLGQHDIPWKSREQFCHTQTPQKTWVYNVFLGIVDCKDITCLIKDMLDSKAEEYNLQNNGQESCLCSLQLNNYGEILQDGFTVPDYFISLACLNKKPQYPKTWLKLAPQISQVIQDVYKNWFNALQKRPSSSVLFEDLESLITDIIDVSEITQLPSMISKNIVIYSSYIRVPNKFSSDREKGEKQFLDITYYEEIIKTLNNPDLSILGSFYIDDIKIVSDAFKNYQKPIGIALQQYLGLTPPEVKHDLRTDKLQIKKLSSPNFLPASRWPISNKVALSIAQQIAVNLATSETKGLFSVNGPPGTGKSTLLRDIISEVITNRAKILADFTNPMEAFISCTSIKSDRFTYKGWSLDPKLLGFEIVIASTNNTAVENISKEIPRASEIDRSYDLEYFSKIATYLNDEECQRNGEGCWGVGSAALGNKKNCSTFFEKFWSKSQNQKSKNEIDNNHGLEYLLDSKEIKSDWKENRQNFLSILAEFTQLKSELVEFKTILEEHATLDAYTKKNDLLKQLKDLRKEIEISQDNVRHCENQLIENNIAREQQQFQLEETKKLQPKWYIVLMELFRAESSYQKWSNRWGDILQEISKLSIENTKLKSEILQSRNIVLDLEKKAADLEANLQELDDKVAKTNEYINSMKSKYLWSSKIADESFWQLSDEEIQLSSPWIHEKLQDLRARVFVAAMNLHYSFIVNSSACIINNFKLIRQKLNFGNVPNTSTELTKSLWATFFLVVPSVSTTFASFNKLFKGLDEAESLGWLLIDEAGQSAPQEALGAIFRAKRAIVVGDPLQIPPVVTISKAINDALLKYYNVNQDWSVSEESVQTLSDRVNIYGTYINHSSGDKQWVGCPLRVHRRCAEPMFSVANAIAYDGLMIQATTPSSYVFDSLYPESQWLDVEGEEFQGHWCAQEGQEVFKIILNMVQKQRSMPNLYVISPFKTVAYQMQHLLYQQSRYFQEHVKFQERNNINNWIKASIGTVHKFQGKQAQTVILLLGGGPYKTGAINWASNSPNILNVALTRAKNKIFIVGNYNLWASKSYFQILANKVSLTRTKPPNKLR